MIISHSKKFICLNPPKTGSGLREAMFQTYSDFDIIKARTAGLRPPRGQGTYRHFNYCLAKEFLEKSNLNIADYFVFTFVRNPWERAVSWANMSCQKENLKIDKQLLITAVRLTIHPNSKQSAYYNVLTEENQPPKKIDYIGSLETHESDIKNIGKILGLDLNPNQDTYRQKSFHKEISKFWDEELIELIRKEEAETIDLKGYVFKY